MKMNQPTREQLNDYARKWLEGTLTEEEKSVFINWYNKDGEQELSWNEEEEILYNQLYAQISDKKDILTLPQRRSTGWYKVAIAATLIGLIATAYFYYQNKNTDTTYQSVYKNDVSPGGNRAMLVLANGNSIDLDSAAIGWLRQEGDVNISKSANGQLVYTGNDGQSVNAFNKIVTPRGGQYKIVLPDGTGVWLNAASSLRYPVNFGPGERKVELTGEAYFEVAKDAKRPFHVIAARQMDVQVLGTHFAVNAYEDEQDIVTTLLEGSVRVRAGTYDPATLKPGQQAVFSDKNIAISPADTATAIAWKNGDFMLDGDISTIMRQIARWYDVEVVYEQSITGKDFLASVPRSSNISEVLRALELTGRVHFKVEGRKVTVMN